MFRMKPDHVGVHFTRVRMPELYTLESLASVEAGLGKAPDTLMPARTDTHVICCDCTLDSFVIGEGKIIEKLN